MVYKALTAAIDNDGNLTLGKRKQTIIWPTELRVGGLYFLHNHRLYKIVSIEQNK